MNTKKRIAFIGVGRVADLHFDAIKLENHRAELIAVSDIRENAVQNKIKEWNVNGYLSYKEMIEQEKPDAVYILLPHHLHLEAVEFAMGRGISVFLEKPIAVDLEQALQIEKIANNSKATLFVAHNGLFHPAFNQVNKLVKTGKIGRPIFVRGISAGWLLFKEWDFRLSKEQTGGGCWMDAGSHLLYCMREIMGKIKSVNAFMANLARGEMEGEDHSVVNIQFENGCLGQAFTSYGHKLPGYELDWPNGYKNAIEIFGDGGAIKYQISPEPIIEFYSEASIDEKNKGWVKLEIKEPYSSSFNYETSHFLDCLENGQQPKVTASDAVEILKILKSAY